MELMNERKAPSQSAHGIDPLSIALVFFIGIMLKTWLFWQCVSTAAKTASC